MLKEIFIKNVEEKYGKTVSDRVKILIENDEIKISCSGSRCQYYLNKALEETLYPKGYGLPNEFRTNTD